VISYSDLDVLLVEDEGGLILARWTGSEWVDAACDPTSYVRDPGGNEIRVDICHLSKFALFGPTNQVFMPVVLRRR
jgi:hypothetical protein